YGCCVRTIGQWSAALSTEIGCRRVFCFAFCAEFGERIPTLRAEVVGRRIVGPAFRAAHRSRHSSRKASDRALLYHPLSATDQQVTARATANCPIARVKQARGGVTGGDGTIREGRC